MYQEFSIFQEKNTWYVLKTKQGRLTSNPVRCHKISRKRRKQRPSGKNKKLQTTNYKNKKSENENENEIEHGPVVRLKRESRSSPQPTYLYGRFCVLIRDDGALSARFSHAEVYPSVLRRHPIPFKQKKKVYIYIYSIYTNTHTRACATTRSGSHSITLTEA